jgi:hypothetical protein
MNCSSSSREPSTLRMSLLEARMVDSGDPDGSGLGLGRGVLFAVCWIRIWSAGLNSAVPSAHYAMLAMQM